MKQYKLLKELPQCGAETIFKETIAGDYVYVDREGHTERISEYTLDKWSDWFLPIPDEPVYDSNWRPKDGENYYYINTITEVDWCPHRENNDYLFDVRKPFPTKDLAEKWLSVLRFRREFEDWYYQTVGNWKVRHTSDFDDRYWYFYPDRQKLTITCTWGIDSYFFWEFETEDQAQQAIDKFGDKLFMLSPIFDVYEEVMR